MTLSSVIEGFVLLRNLWEYNSILKYRYKKRKAYKVAKMKHLPAPLAKEYKPNLAVRQSKCKFKVGDLVYYKNHGYPLHKGITYKVIGCYDGGSKNGIMINVVDTKDSNNKWSLFEKDLTTTNPKQEIGERNKEDVDFEFWERELGVTIEYAYNSVHNFYESITLKDTSSDTMFMERCVNVSASQVEDVIQSMYVKLSNNMYNYNTLNQAVIEPKLTHVRYLGKRRGRYFTQGYFYRVVEDKVYKDGSWYVKFETNIEGEEHCRFFRNSKGVNEYEDEFELIYDNENGSRVNHNYEFIYTQ